MLIVKLSYFGVVHTNMTYLQVCKPLKLLRIWLFEFFFFVVILHTNQWRGCLIFCWSNRKIPNNLNIPTKFFSRRKHLGLIKASQSAPQFANIYTYETPNQFNWLNDWRSWTVFIDIQIECQIFSRNFRQKNGGNLINFQHIVKVWSSERYIRKFYKKNVLWTM